MTYNVLTVANIFLEKIGRQNHALKIQKLIFFAHGWYLGLYDKPLIDDTFFAWHRGPVNKQLFYENRNRKNGRLFTIEHEEKVADNDAIFISKIHTMYKQYTGYQLSEMTHQAGTPWHETCKEYLEKDEEIPFNLQISQDEITNYFRGLINQARNHESN